MRMSTSTGLTSKSTTPFTRTQVWTGSVTWKHDLREKTYDGLFPRDVQSLLATFPVRSPEASDRANAQAGAEAPPR